MSTRKFVIIIEKGEAACGAHVPDLPGCAVAAPTKEEALEMIKEAVDYHLDQCRKRGEPMPRPSTEIALYEVEEDF